MTRKHFTTIAVALHSCRPDRGLEYVGDAVYEGWWEAVRSIADTCEATNPRFDRGKFIRVAENGP